MRLTSLPSVRRALIPAVALAAASAGLCASDASAGGPVLPPGQELGTQPGDVNGVTFANSDLCRNCHYTGTSIEPYMAGDTWAGTMMANSMRDPAFHAALAVANQDEPGIGTLCIRCHSPLAYVRGNATADPTGATSLVDDVDSHGVSCEGCHRATTAPAEDGLDTPYRLGDARLYYDDVLKKRGPYVSCADDPEDPECSESPGHDTLQATSLSDSSFCGQCHQVTIPGRKLRDELGAVTAHDFPLDTTYPEWAASDFAPGKPEEKTCQGCHMLTDKDGPACNLFDAVDREAIPQHGFVGGNYWGIQAVMETHPDRVDLYASAFQNALTQTMDMLQRAASVTILEIPAEAAPGDTIDVRVRVENLSGHKFPTGYAESRRAWLQVSVSAGQFPAPDRVLIGAYDDVSGEIEDPAATRVYHAEHGTWNGSEAVADGHLVLHDSVVVDTRIPPKGFVPDATTLPKGSIDYADGDGGFNNFDEVTFTVTLPSDIEDPVAGLHVSLVYQSMTRSYVEFLQDENDTNVAGDVLRDAYEATSAAPPLLVASAAQDIALPINEGTGGGGAGGGGGGAGGTTGGTTTTAVTSTAAGPAATTGQGGEGGEGPSNRGSASPSDDCGCRVVGAPVERSGLAAAVLMALGGAIARRTRRRGRAAARAAR